MRRRGGSSQIPGLFALERRSPAGRSDCRRGRMRPGDPHSAGGGRDPTRISGLRTVLSEALASVSDSATQTRTFDNAQISAAEGTLLSGKWFRFILRWALWHAIRYGHSVSLITIAALREHAGVTFAGSSALLAELADTISRAIRQTDLVGELEDGQLGIMISDADDAEAVAIIRRLTDLLSQVQFSTSLLMHISVACCPTNGSDIDGLFAHTLSHPLLNLRNVSTAQIGVLRVPD
jgi:hypothetical protein